MTRSAATPRQPRRAIVPTAIPACSGWQFSGSAGAWNSARSGLRRLFSTYFKPATEKVQIWRIFFAMRVHLHAPEEARRSERNRHTVHFTNDNVLGGFRVVYAAG